MPFEVLPHPADVRFRATGPTLDDAFAAVVDALAAITESTGGADQRHPVVVESEDREALLFDFLARLILLAEVDDCALSHAEELTVAETDAGYRLEATVVGGTIDPDSPLFDVKSPTYSGMRVERAGAGAGDEWIIEATLDI